jgi:hypothetical protein
MRVEYMKDGGSEGEVVSVALKPVDVGMDADGLPITSCVVVPTEAVAQAERGARLPKTQQTLLGILKDSSRA